jgi:hypothetical protein
MTTVHAKIEIESCEECPYSERSSNDTALYCNKDNPHGRFIDWIADYEDIPYWCPLRDKEACPGCDQPHHTCLCTHDSDDGC